MAHYFPYIVNDKTDLRCAQKTNEVVIVCTDKTFFVELDKKVSGNKFIRRTKSASVKGLIAGGLLTLFTGGLGLIVLGISAFGTIAGVVLDEFKDYKAIMDYVDKRVIFLRTTGKNAFNENSDSIEGIDINKIVMKNNQ